MIYLAGSTLKRFKCAEPTTTTIAVAKDLIEYGVARSMICNQGTFTPVFDSVFESSEAFNKLRLGVSFKVTPMLLMPEERVFIRNDDIIFITQKDRPHMLKMLLVTDRSLNCENISKEFH